MSDCAGPDHCWDDLCAGQDYGMCGRPSATIVCLEMGIHTDDCDLPHEDWWDDDDD